MDAENELSVCLMLIKEKKLLVMGLVLSQRNSQGLLYTARKSQKSKIQVPEC
jgi:hypothetical protein